MAWDLGIAALLALGALSVAVGLVVQLICNSDSAWFWVRVAVVYFVVCAWMAYAWFGWASAGDLTIEDLLLVGIAPIPAVVLVVRSTAHGSGRRAGRHSKPAPRSGRPTPHAL